MTVARRTPGPAYANLQGRKPREVWSGRASDAMGISASAVFGRGLPTAALGHDCAGDEASRSIAMGRTGVARRNTNDKRAVQCCTQASLVIAGREPAKERPAFLLDTDFDHDVSILIMAVEVAGR
jgi:hypothetical protein